jgi:serine/threonine protein kinase
MELLKLICSAFSDSPAGERPVSRNKTDQAAKVADSEATLVASGSSKRFHVACYLKEHTIAAGKIVLAKLNPGKQARTVNRSFSARGRYTPVKHLGQGGNGDVHLCRDRKLGTLVAVKTLSHQDSSLPDEVLVLQQLGQQSDIIKYYRTFHRMGHPDLAYLVFEYCELGDLAHYINDTRDDLPEMFIWHVFKNMANGLSFIHSSGVVHGDLKPANILLSPTGTDEIYPRLKIADFGAATVYPECDIPLGHLATLGWQPPEADWRYGAESDIWALGCIIHELALHRLPICEFEAPPLDPVLWFHLSGKTIPANTPHQTTYKYLCHFMAFHPPEVVRIDRPSPYTSIVYSKLLNYMMMRTLDTNYRSRVTSFELHRLLPVLEPLIHELMLSGQEALLDRFDDGRDHVWRMISNMTDSGVLEQLFYVLALRAQSTRDVSLFTWAKPLLQMMDSAERAAACQFVVDVGVLQSS